MKKLPHLLNELIRRVLLLMARKKTSAYVLIASPRSASNYVRNLLCKGFHVAPYSLKTESGFGHFAIDTFKMPLFGRWLWYQHLYPTDLNKMFVKRFSFGPPIITYRAPVEWVLSVSEWIEKKGHSPWGTEDDETLFRSMLHNSNLEVSESDLITSKEQKTAIDFVIIYDLPLYLRFLNGWVNASKHFPEHQKPIFFGYRAIVERPIHFLNEVKTHYKEFDVETAKAAVSDKVNYNVGVTRVAADYLSAEQLNSIDLMVTRSSLELFVRNDKTGIWIERE